MLYKKIFLTKEKTSHTITSDWLSQDSKILDVGCACGDLGIMISKKNNSTIYGIDANKKSIEKATQTKAYKDIVFLDLNNFSRKDCPDFIEVFDYIILADVLEHLLNPRQVITELKPFLKKTGAFIISLPNVAHASIKANLLLNDFTYTKCGILDETHLHLFTADSINHFLSDNQLEITDLDYTALPPNGYQPNKISDLPKEIQTFILEDTQSHIMQYVFIAKPSMSNSGTIYKKNKEFFSINKIDNIGDFLFKIKRLIILRLPWLIKILEKL